MTSEKVKNLRVIKEEIDRQYEGHLTMTPSALYCVLCVFSDYLIMDKVGETIQQEVKDFYSQYDFIEVKERGVGWTIAYRG